MLGCVAQSPLAGESRGASVLMECNCVKRCGPRPPDGGLRCADALPGASPKGADFLFLNYKDVTAIDLVILALKRALALLQV